jgi:sugar (pentulose or hexulose) kinase
MRRIAVLDIGKTNAKVLVVDLCTGVEEVLARTPNAVVRDGLYPHHDLDMLWGFALSGLRLAAERGVDAVSITTHGVHHHAWGGLRAGGRSGWAGTADAGL